MAPHTPPAGAPSRALFARVGQALYGLQFQEALARALGVSGRSVRYWVAGDHPIPSGVWGELRALVEQHRLRLADLLDELP